MRMPGRAALAVPKRWPSQPKPLSDRSREEAREATSDRVQRKCPVAVSSGRVDWKCPVEVSSGSVQWKCQEEVSSRSVDWKCTGAPLGPKVGSGSVRAWVRDQSERGFGWRDSPTHCAPCSAARLARPGRTDRSPPRPECWARFFVGRQGSYTYKYVLYLLILILTRLIFVRGSFGVETGVARGCGVAVDAGVSGVNAVVNADHCRV